jgi:extracellular factor (EF) 3-hydroxypalmitic acid methyl ester biosynthesis protein
VLPLNLIEPVVTFANSQGTAVRGTLISLQRRSLVMEIYNPYSIVQVSEVLGALTIRAGQKIVYQGRAVVTSLLNTGLMAVASVTLIDEWSDLNSVGGDTVRYGEAARRFVDEWQARFRVRRPYQVAVSEMRAFLSDTARWLDQADLSGALPREADGRLREDVFYEIALPVVQQVDDHVRRLEHEARQTPDEDAVIHRAYAQAALHPLLLRAPFAYRAFAKPLGYAGDYEMVKQILSDPRQGGSTYFQVINSMYLQTEVAKAHRNRIDVLEDRLVQLSCRDTTSERRRILNVGCGPAFEVERLLARTGNVQPLELTLVDFNEETLNYARSRLESVKSADIEIKFMHASVHELLKRSGDGSLQFGNFDFVYCAGLFDYLSEKICTRLVRQFVQWTRPGGRILVTNVHLSNPQRFVMEHVLEWHLIYRDESMMQALFPSAGFAVDVFTDLTGVNVFAEVLLDPRA